jgi:hypothetical protein
MCSITVNLTNNTGQSPITFNTFSFLEETGSKFTANAPPFMVSCNIQSDGISAKALYAKGYSYVGMGFGTTAYYSVVTSGTAIFNMPNGDTLTVIWNLNAMLSENPTPTLTPTGNNYTYSGIASPTITNGDDYVFDVIIS